MGGGTSRAKYFTWTNDQPSPPVGSATKHCAGPPCPFRLRVLGCSTKMAWRTHCGRWFHITPPIDSGQELHTLVQWCYATHETEKGTKGCQVPVTCLRQLNNVYIWYRQMDNPTHGGSQSPDLKPRQLCTHSRMEQLNTHLLPFTRNNTLSSSDHATLVLSFPPGWATTGTSWRWVSTNAPCWCRVSSMRPNAAASAPIAAHKSRHRKGDDVCENMLGSHTSHARQKKRQRHDAGFLSG